MAEGSTCSVSGVFDTVGQLFHRARLCTDGRLQHCEEQWLLLCWIKEVLERVFRRNDQNPGVPSAACMLTKFKLNNPVNVSPDLSFQPFNVFFCCQ